MRTCGRTPMGRALERAWKTRVESIILITDGQPTDWTTEDILEEAEEYFFIPIHIIGIGDPYSLELNEPFLKELADITGGTYNRVGEGELYTLSTIPNQGLDITGCFYWSVRFWRKCCLGNVNE